MTEIDDDKLLKQYFCENKQEIADNGFTERVMKRLPDRARRLSNLLMTTGIMSALILFYALDGFGAILGTLRGVFFSIPWQGVGNLDIKSLMLTMAILLFFGVRKIYTME